MSTQLSKKSVARNYAFLAVMLGAMILGSIVGWILPQELDAEGNVISAGATVLEPLGTLFLNMMFCIVVPMVFASICRVCGHHEEPQTGRQDHGHHRADLRHHRRHRCRHHVRR